MGITRDDFFGNNLRAAEAASERRLARIGKPTDKTEWNMTTPTVNAFYNAEFNSINFPAGILQPPFFDPQRDPAANLGAIGAVIGHEMTHGFDDQGRKFDSGGNLRARLLETRRGYERLDRACVRPALALGDSTLPAGGPFFQASRMPSLSLLFTGVEKITAA